jgi:hypothetical protein
MQFVQESLSTIRRRLGYLVYRDQFLYGAALATSANTITLQKAKRLSPAKLTGHVLYMLTGAAVGETVNVSTSAQGTGVVTVVPSFTVTPAIGDVAEIWPDGADPDQINQYINMAILDVQSLASVIARETLTGAEIASDRLSVTIPATWTKVARLTYKDAGGTRHTFRPRGPLDALDSDRVFDVQEQTLELKYAIPSDATVVQAIGYRPPALLTADADLAEVRSDFLMYKAASLLAASDAEGPQLDPEGHAAQALTWAREADRLRYTMSLQHLSNTALVDQVF